MCPLRGTWFYFAFSLVSFTGPWLIIYQDPMPHRDSKNGCGKNPEHSEYVSRIIIVKKRIDLNQLSQAPILLTG